MGAKIHPALLALFILPIRDGNSYEATRGDRDGKLFILPIRDGNRKRWGACLLMIFAFLYFL